VSFATLTVISMVALVGPLLALPQRWHLPVVLGELVAGVVMGPSAVGYLHADNTTFTFLADIGFALVMFVAGSHVPIRDVSMHIEFRTGAFRALGVAVVAVPVAIGAAELFGTGHWAVYAVLMSSSSAAVVLPIVDSLRLGGTPVREMLPQVAVTDTACIIALPLVIDPNRIGRTALGAVAVLATAMVLFVLLRHLERVGSRRRLHRISEERKFALELRISLMILFGLAALAVQTRVSIMLAGFCFGLVVAAIGEPRRLARQLFAVTEGFFAPLFFVWLGASLDLSQLVRYPSYILLGLALGVGAVAVHALMWLSGQPVPLAMLAAAQLGVAVGAATLGTQLHLLRPGEPAALMLSALVTIVVAAVSGALVANAGLTRRQDDL
jgi:Kef-type K+ transport system membrane component KefB